MPKAVGASLTALQWAPSIKNALETSQVYVTALESSVSEVREPTQGHPMRDSVAQRRREGRHGWRSHRGPLGQYAQSDHGVR